MRRLLLFFLLAGAAVLSATDLSQKIDRLVKDSYEQEFFNGNVLAAKNGEIIFQRAYGLADPFTNTPLTLDSNFNLASVSKQFTAMAVMILKARGKLSYDDEITRFLPGLPYPGVTVRHLLNHTGGLPDYMNLFASKWDPDQPNSALKKTASNADIVALLKKHAPPRDFEPGANWAYSNTGYCLLASIVEAASGAPFHQFLKEGIFDPLDMKQTLVYSKIRNPPITNRTLGFRRSVDGKGYEPNDLIYLDGIYGDGAIYSNLADLFKWSQALSSQKLLPRADLDEAFNPARLNDGGAHPYGFGWSLLEIGGQRAVAHSGGWVGFRSYIVRRLESGDVVIVLANNTVASTGRLARAIDLIVHEQPHEPIKTPISIVIGKILMNKGEKAAIAAYADLKRNQPERYDFSEWLLNALGYQLLEMDKKEQAVAVFKINHAEFPTSANANDSLAEAYFKSEQWPLALVHYQKVLEHDAGNKHAAEMIGKIKQKIGSD